MNEFKGVEKDERVEAGRRIRKNWFGLSFINLSTTSAKLAAPTLNQADEKKIFIDALGRKAGSSSLRIPQILAPNR